MSLVGYDPCDPLASALFWEAHDLVSIIVPSPYVLYCDGSKSSENRYTVVAGAIASVEQWKAFNEEWNDALMDEHLAYFRMSEFAHSTKQFAKGWKGNEKRRRALLDRLIGVIRENIECWIGACVSQEQYDAADQKYKLREYLQPHALCGLTAVELAHKWRESQRLDMLPMEYIFECGDDYADQLRNAVRRDFGKEPIFRPKMPNEKCPNDRPLTPLQIGDFAAYEMGKFYGLMDNYQKLWERFRHSFVMLGKLRQNWGNLTDEGIRVILNLRSVEKR